MKNYQTVIEERYDKQQYNGTGILKNMYAPINPVGFYGEFKSAQILSDLVSMLIAHEDMTDLEEIKICDFGCGDGLKTRFMAELLGNPSQVYGIEYSKNRLQHCKNMNCNIHYAYADITKLGSIPFDVQFDAITTFVVFMHFDTKKQIYHALKNIYNSLKKDGLFLWYDVNVKSHWNGAKDTDGHGFSGAEMDRYASKVGFKLVKSYGVYSHVPIVNESTIYLANKVKNIVTLEALDKLPFKKNNLIRIYRKE